MRLSLSLALSLTLTVPLTHHASQVTQLGGFWVKLAQGASVVSALPDAYAAELCKLQDAMPADPIHVVHATLRAELGAEWRQLVTQLEPDPIGSATIAQVHRATLRLPRVNGGGEIDEVEAVLKVRHPPGSATPCHPGCSPAHARLQPCAPRLQPCALQVQHPRIAEQLAIDIHASTLLAMLLEAVAPNLFRDMRPIVRELAEITRGELDFAQAWLRSSSPPCLWGQPSPVASSAFIAADSPLFITPGGEQPDARGARARRLRAARARADGLPAAGDPPAAGDGVRRRRQAHAGKWPAN